MLEENHAKLRTHHKNIQRYRQLLETSLTDFEREYIGKRLAEERSAFETIAETIRLLAAPNDSVVHPGNPRAA
jgi:hypothetical protein